jgi:hydrogenase maturation protease
VEGRLKILVLGLGNHYLSDDSAGLRVIHQLRDRIDRPDVAFAEMGVSGLGLLEEIIGYNKLVLIDSIKTRQGKPGQVYKLRLEDLNPSMDFCSSHGIDFATVIELGKRLSYQIPEEISIYAIEIEDNSTFSEQCTPDVEKIIPVVTEQIIREEKLSQ